MGSLTIGIVMAVVTLALLLTGIPIAFALGLVSVGSILLFLDITTFNMVAEFVYGSLNNFSLLAIPLFIFMGGIFARSRASSDLFETAYLWTGKVPGGLAISSVVSSALFAALSGSSPATAAAIGKVAIPQMKKRGYSNSISTGAVVAGGTLGILIPPSVTLILYGIAVEESIGQLFVAGVIPGILVVLLFCLWIYVATLLERRKAGVQSAAAVEKSESESTVSKDGDDITPSGFSWKQRFVSLLYVLPFLLLIVGVLASLYLGIATPSEAAAFGAVLALLMVIVVYRSMTWKKLMNLLLESTKESTMVLLIIAFSALIGTTMSYLHIPQDLATYITSLDMSKWLVLIIINLFLIMLGFFIPPAAIILMTTPILFPIITGLGFDPIWFGIVMTLNMEMGLITPPVGLNIFVVKGIAPDIPTNDIIRGSIPYVGLLAIGIVILTIFPSLVTWLPNLLF
ncbi:TRAP transporter large permease [Alteribacillus iranensis]|uniref:TRAP transporter, DctM subunit n=1 Tax=Alteribacillus iranensis TaxID=930128 RepID=A0A1I2E3S1_9BACI|nr:TRAP transporter large permease [Alteribacillus iranensis]SFE87181.1 TRAP transporter, DctM subunit [Alteribacillus iranensis]